jgi:predicted RecB family nuclease
MDGVDSHQAAGGGHGTCADAVDQLLRAGFFVDLYRIVRQGLRASVESYSIKKLEPHPEHGRNPGIGKEHSPDQARSNLEAS